MANRDGAAVDVHLGVVDAEHVRTAQRHGRERLVELPQVNVFHTQAVALEKTRHRHRRPDTHLIGFTPADCEALEGAERREAAPHRLTLFHEHARGGAIRQLRRIACGHGRIGIEDLSFSVLIHDGRQLGEPRERRVGLVALVLDDARLHLAHLAGHLVRDHHRHIHRHDLGVEESSGLRRRCALLRGERVLVEALARDAVAMRDDVGGVYHGHPQSGVRLH